MSNIAPTTNTQIPRVILYRDRLAGCWMATSMGVSKRHDVTWQTSYSSAEKAGDVAKAIQRANPNTAIGIKATEFGTATIRAYGEVVWLRGQILDNGMMES